MLVQLKSEIRKLFSVRSTYILVSLLFVLISLFAYFGTSSATYEEAVCESTGEVLYSADQMHPGLEEAPPEELCDGTVNYTMKTSRDLPKEKLPYTLQETMPLTSVFVAIILILLMVHEYRYNIINHTLTISNSRSKVILAKLVVSVIFTISIALLAMALAVGVTYLAVSVKDLSLPAQDYDWLYVVARHLGYTLGYALFCLGVATLVRNIVAGIAAVFILPTIDGIFGLLLSLRNIEPTKALPFSALDRFGSVAPDIAASNVSAVERAADASSRQEATVLASLAVFGLYFLLLWIITWVLFLKRDAN